MKSLALGIAFIINAFPLHAQQLTEGLFPSAYYTEGTYSNGTRARSYSGYALLSLNGFDYLITGYDKMTVESSTWSYDQRLFVVGGMKNLYPFYLKLNYGRIQGTFNRPRPRYSYADGIDLLNAGLRYNADLIFVGLTYTYASVAGYKRVRCDQVSISGEWLVDPAFSVSLSPLYSTLTDGRSLVSVSAGISYSPWQPLVLQVSGALGRRAYYFNPDLLTVFNQDETQENLWGIRAEYAIEEAVTLVGSYQSSDFTGYKAKYVSIGARAHIGW